MFSDDHRSIDPVSHRELIVADCCAKASNAARMLPECINCRQDSVDGNIFVSQFQREC
jgi:hypothetical protein